MHPGDLKALQGRLMIFYLGRGRIASEVAGSVIENIPNRKEQLQRMRGFVDQSEGLLSNGDLDGFGSLMHENWLLKRELSTAVSTDSVDEAYETARRAGALGGKLLGAGSTSFMLFYVPIVRQPAVAEAMSAFVHVPFNFESHGTRVIYDGVNLGERRRTSDPEAVQAA